MFKNLNHVSVFPATVLVFEKIKKSDTPRLFYEKIWMVIKKQAQRGLQLYLRHANIYIFVVMFMRLEANK